MEFKTIKENGRVEEEIKKSRFICHVKRVETEEEARDFINSIKKEHYCLYLGRKKRNKEN